MTRERLVPCPSCGAHVRTSEPRTCPFCDERATDPSAQASSTSSFGVRGGFVAASLLTLSACAGEPETPPDESDTGGEVVVEDIQVPPDIDGNSFEDEDGAADESSDATPPPSDAERDDGPAEPPPAAAYGGPPDSVMQPLYGIAPD